MHTPSFSEVQMSIRAHSVLVVNLRPGGGYQLSHTGPSNDDTRKLLVHRLPCLNPFLDTAADVLAQLGHDEARFAVQLHDEDPEPICFRFDAPLDPDGKGPLIPDPYVLGSNGYASLRRQFSEQLLPPWQERLPIAIWRGSSTGSSELSPQSLHRNSRLQLCVQSKRLPYLLDARISAVVQCPDAVSKAEVERLLQDKQLLAPRMSPWHLALHRWILEIDGNVNSWGLLWKLLSGSCILRVASPRRQWYHHRLQPWVHMVPIAADLSDLEDILAWCHSNPQTCRAIAEAGQQLAFDVINQLNTDQREAVEVYAANWLRTRLA
jgi:hypothetical protein